MSLRPSLLVTLLSLAVLGGACADPDAAAPSLPTPAPSTTSPPAEDPALEDGRHFTFVESVDLEAGTVTFDLAEFLTGEEANAAAREDGVIGPDETVDNDYYIRNRSSQLRTLALSEDATLTLVGWDNCCDDPEEGDLELWAESFEEGQASPEYRGPTSPWWLTVEGGEIVAIEEQYLP